MKKNKLPIILICVLAFLIIGMTVAIVYLKNQDKTGYKSYDTNTVIMTVNDEKITWEEYYGWICYSRAQVELLSGSISDWGAEANSTQNYAQYVKDYAVYLISVYKGVEYNAKVIGIELTDEEIEEIEKTCDSVYASDEAAVLKAYSSIDFYKYLSKLSSLYTKCHDYQYGKDGEKTDEENIVAFASEKGYEMFKGVLITGQDTADAEEKGRAVIAQLKNAEDISEEIDALRIEYGISDGYDSGYVFPKGGFDDEIESALSALQIGEYTAVSTAKGVWIVMKMTADYDTAVYNDDHTVRELASWDVFSSVIEGWSENVSMNGTDVYNEIDVGKIFN